MATIIDALIVTLGLDDTDYTEGANRAASSQSRLKDSTKRNMGEVESTVKKTGGAVKELSANFGALVLGFLGAKSAFGFVEGIAKANIEMDNLSTRSQVSIERLAQLNAAFRSLAPSLGENGGSEAIERLNTLKNAVPLGQVSPEQMRALSFLGADVADLNNPDKALQKIMRRIPNIDPRLAQNSLQALGLNPSLFNASVDAQKQGGLEKVYAQFAKAGEGAEADADAAKKLNDAFNALKVTLITDVTPGLTKAFGWLTKLLSGENPNERLPTGQADAQFKKDHPILAAMGFGVFSNKYTDAQAQKARGGPAAPAQTTADTNAKLVQGVRFFQGQGKTQEQAIGIMAGFAAESGLNHNIRNSVAMSGIGQWNGARRADFARYFGKSFLDKNGRVQATYAEQLAFAAHEMKNKEARAGRLMGGAKSAEEAAYYHTTAYERPARGAETIGDLHRGRAFIARTRQLMAQSQNAVRQQAGNATQNVHVNMAVHTRSNDPHKDSKFWAGELERTLKKRTMMVGKSVSGLN